MNRESIVKYCQDKTNPSKRRHLTCATDPIVEDPTLRRSEYFEKLSTVTMSCHQIQKELAAQYKNAKKSFKSKLQKISKPLEEQDHSWKTQLEKYKEIRARPDQLYLKLKSMSLPEIVVKEPIKRMQAKKNLTVPQRSRISITEVASSKGKLILSNNKRGFGQLGNSEKKIQASARLSSIR